MFHRVQNCFGITLWAWRTRVELWLCLSEVEKHSHPGQAVEIIPIFGWSRFYRVSPKGEQCVNIRPRKWFRAFSIPAGWEHWFKGVPLVFLNVSHSKVSAAKNFVAT